MYILNQSLIILYNHFDCDEIQNFETKVLDLEQYQAMLYHHQYQWPVGTQKCKKIAWTTRSIQILLHISCCSNTYHNFPEVFLAPALSGGLYSLLA